MSSANIGNTNVGRSFSLILATVGVPFPGSPQLVLSVGFEGMASPTAEMDGIIVILYSVSWVIKSQLFIPVDALNTNNGLFHFLQRLAKGKPYNSLRTV